MKKLLPFALAFSLISTLLINTPLVTYAANSSTQVTLQSNSYNTILNALLQNDTNGTFDPNEVAPTEVGALIKQVVQDNPAVLYYKSAKVWTDGKIEFNYYVDSKTIQKQRAELNAKVDKVVASIKKTTKTDFDKVKAVHDYLVLNTAYDYKNQQKKTIPAESYTAYGALIKSIAVCDGYTKAAQIFLDRLGIENEYVVGTVNGTLHAWNQVKLDGKYYFMDITWDDPVPNKPGKVSYNYFLVTTDQLKKDHAWNETLWAKASDKQFSYFSDKKVK